MQTVIGSAHRDLEETDTCAITESACDRDSPRVALPRPEVHVVVRFGPTAKNGLDVHAFGARLHVHRKVIRRGQRIIMARLRLGAHVFGVPASELTGRVVPLDEIAPAEARRLLDRLATAPDPARVLEKAITERADRNASKLTRDAATLLTTSSVTAAAGDLGVSERHLRRVFRESVGLSPKEFAKLTRFHRALQAAKRGAVNWASIAAATGYYDQAHLIAEFRAIAGVTPRALLDELRSQ